MGGGREGRKQREQEKPGKKGKEIKSYEHVLLHDYLQIVAYADGHVIIHIY